MKYEANDIQNDFDTEIYWFKLVFSDNGSKMSKVLAGISRESIDEKIGNEQEKKQRLIDWKKSVIHKWSNHSQNIFNKDVHYDCYSITPEAKEVMVEFLRSKS